MQMIKALLVATLLVQAPAAFSQEVTSTGSATVDFSKKMTAKTKDEALRKARVNALDRYIEAGGQGKARNYGFGRDGIISDLDTYVFPDVSIVSEQTDEKLKRYTVAIRATIKSGNLENKLLDTSGIGTATAKEKSTIAFIFVAREQRSVKSFDDKVTKRMDREYSGAGSAAAAEETAESEKIKKSSVKTATDIKRSADLQVNDSASVTTGGSTTRKAEQVEWSVAPAAEIDTVFTEILSRAGYDTAALQDIPGTNFEAIRKDYATGDDLSAATRTATADSVRAVGGVPYMIYGTLDVGLAARDPASGQIQVYVKVSAKALDVSGRFPRNVAAVGPEQFSGLGPNADVARTNALKQAASAAGDKLMNAMNAKGVK